MADSTQLGIFLQSQLNIYDPQLIRTQYKQAWTIDGLMHRTFGDLPIAARKIVSTLFDESGEAAVYDGRTFDIPVVEVGAEAIEFKSLMFVIGCKWNEMELEEAALASQNPGMIVIDPLTERYGAMKRKMDQKMHDSILFGDRARNFNGFFNPSMFASTPAADPSKKPLIMSDIELFNWVSDQILAFRLNQGLQNTGVFLYLDPTLFRRFNGILTNGTSQTVATQLKGANGQGVLADIREILELDPVNLQNRGVSLANTGRMLLGAYNDDMSAKRRYTPFKRYPVEKIPGTLDYVSIGIAATSEMMYRVPMNFKAINYSTALV
jgi:Uncharacterized protein conserved in bacteria (DUF2184)